MRLMGIFPRSGSSGRIPHFTKRIQFFVIPHFVKQACVSFQMMFSSPRNLAYRDYCDVRD